MKRWKKNQANDENIPNNPSTISPTSDEEMRHASSSSNDNNSSDE
jgi:hypothetical protein